MTRFVEKLRLKELAEEDIYFARRDRELIEAMHARELAKTVGAVGRKERKLARSFEKEYRQVRKSCKKKPRKLVRALRKLIRKILVAFHLAGKEHLDRG